MIFYCNKSIFDMTTEAIVNTVNTEGVMGKGLALQFKLKYPLMYQEYKRQCLRRDFKTGMVMPIRIGEFNPQWCINFPTKSLWRLPSEMSYITEGLQALKWAIDELGIRSIAIPKLGCNNGGLPWKDVHAEIVNALKDVSIAIHIMGDKPE